jgi:hypothetical protein
MFAKSPKLTSLLVYITRKAIEERLDELTETRIGVNVFGRPAGYSSGEDNIVRSHARLLRQKLESFFEEAGDSEGLILTIPKGGYVPVFAPRTQPSQAEAVPDAPSLPDEPVEPVTAEPHSPVSSRNRWIAVSATVILVAVALTAFLRIGPSPNTASGQRISHLLWSRVFQPNRNTILVAADSGLVMYENLARRTVPLSEYLGHQYLSSPLEPNSDAAPRTIRGLGARRYTSIVDLDLMTSLVRLPEVAPGRFRIRYARDLSMGDFKESNVLLSGAAEANPWLELFENRLNFKVEDDQAQSVFQVTNKSPNPGEQTAYRYNPLKPEQRAFSVVAFLSDRFGPTNAVVIEGTTVAGTEAAADFMLDDNAIAPILRRAMLSDGTLGDFEVLLETRNLAGSAPRAQIVATRFGQSNQ